MKTNINKITIDGVDYSLSATETKNTYSYKNKKLLNFTDNGFDIDGTYIMPDKSLELSQRIATQKYTDENIYTYKEDSGELSNFCVGVIARDIERIDGKGSFGMDLASGGKFTLNLPDTSACGSFGSIMTVLNENFTLTQVPYWDCNCYTNSAEFATTVGNYDSKLLEIINKSSKFEWSIIDSSTNTPYADLSDAKKEVFISSFLNKTGLINTMWFSDYYMGDDIIGKWENFVANAHFCILYLDVDTWPKIYMYIAPNASPVQNELAILVSSDYTFTDIIARRM